MIGHITLRQFKFCFDRAHCIKTSQILLWTGT